MSIRIVVVEVSSTELHFMCWLCHERIQITPHGSSIAGIYNCPQCNEWYTVSKENGIAFATVAE